MIDVRLSGPQPNATSCPHAPIASATHRSEVTATGVAFTIRGLLAVVCRLPSTRAGGRPARLRALAAGLALARLGRAGAAVAAAGRRPRPLLRGERQRLDDRVVEHGDNGRRERAER